MPPKPLSKKELLGVLRKLNTLLTVRLNLHEDVPEEMKDFTIASGRATFHVKDEFELDLSIAEEDPSSQLYFVDFRFTFAPCGANLPEGPLRNHIEGRVNDLLRREGLSACYRFLHDLVLTHKLSILRKQGYEMARSHWSENIRVEAVHRSIVVQYWLTRPGGKSWLEIGIRKGRPKGAGYSLLPDNPYIAIRCFRHGKEVVDHNVQLNLADLSMEAILKQVITKHTNYIFKEVKRQMKRQAIFSLHLLFVKHRAHPYEPTECSLKVQLLHSKDVAIVQEPISGSFALSPPSQLHTVFERQLNGLKDPAFEAASRLGNLRAITASEHVELRTKMCGWRKAKNYSPNLETLKKLFGSDQVRVRFFKPRGWNNSWILAFTASSSGDQWWIVETQEPTSDPGLSSQASQGYQPFRRALEIKPNDSSALVFDPTFDLLQIVEKTAAALVLQFVDCRELTGRKIEYGQRQPSAASKELAVPDLCIRLPENVLASPSNAKHPPPWCHEYIKSSFLGLSRSRTQIRTVVSGRLMDKISYVDSVSERMDPTLAFHPQSGTFAFRLGASIGESTIPELLERLARIRKLINFIDTIRKHGFSCSTVSLTSLTFAYGGFSTEADTDISEGFSTTISFPSEGNMRLSFEARSPHLCIADFLNSILNDPTGQGLDDVARTLRATFPVLRTLYSLESCYQVENSTSRFHLLPRSATCYRIRYSNGNVVLEYEIRLRQRMDSLVWNLSLGKIGLTRKAVHGGADPAIPSKNEDFGSKPNGKNKPGLAASKDVQAKSGSKPDPQRSNPDSPIARSNLETVTQAWANMTRERGPQWSGLGSGMMAHADGVEACVKRVDEAMRELLARDPADGPAADEAADSGGKEAGTAPPAQPPAQAPEKNPSTIDRAAAAPAKAGQAAGAGAPTKPGQTPAAKASAAKGGPAAKGGLPSAGAPSKAGHGKGGPVKGGPQAKTSATSKKNSGKDIVVLD